ncbi:hypothetical protein V8B97DRAFT_2025720 [Scleroderma yunnanense]
MATIVLGRFFTHQGLEFRDDETTTYVILSHRWNGRGVNYDEIVKLSKMEKDEQDEVCRCPGYKKTKKDEYDSAELSEAISSMDEWYENSRICFVYLHDAPGPSFPIEYDKRTYPSSNGYSEWCSRGWTLQENPHLLTNGLSSNHPCVAQIMSTVYSLFGLLDVKMPILLYGEGKKAFHHLQSVFTWGFNRELGRLAVSLLTTFFKGCHEMELMDSDKLVQDPKHPWLPYRCRPLDLPVQITLALWNSNYYRYSTLGEEYRDTPHGATFEIDDSAVIKNGKFTYCGAYLSKLTGNTFTLTSTDPCRVQAYCDHQAHCLFAVGFWPCLGRDWIHFVYK